MDWVDGCFPFYWRLFYYIFGVDCGQLETGLISQFDLHKHKFTNMEVLSREGIFYSIISSIQFQIVLR